MPAEGPLPSFTWGESETVDNVAVFNLKVDFNDGGLTDVAQLMRDRNDDITPEQEEAENECVLQGFLEFESEVPVTVAGCPGSDSFEVVIQSDRLPANIYEVEAGKVKVYQPIPNPDEGDETKDEGVDITVSEREMQSLIAAARTTGLVQNRNLPSQFRLSVALRYDNLYLNNVCNGDHNLAKARAREIINLAQNFYRNPALGTRIELDITSIKYVNTDARLRRGAACDVGCTLEKLAESFTKPDSEKADNYHYLSQDPQGGVTGVARGVGYRSWEYSGSVCWANQKDRTAVTEVMGPDWYTWNQKRMGAAATFAHELGHALGMPHDFTTSTTTPKLDKSGNSCLNVDGVMSYKNSKTTWSQCSREAITGWFAQLSNVGINCKGQNPCKDNCKSGGSAGSCPLSAMICDNPDRYGGCNGQFKSYFKDHCQKTCGICTDSSSGGSGGGSPQPPAPAACTDQCGSSSTNCPNGLPSGFCDNSMYGGCSGINGAYYARYCKKMCNKC